MTGCSLCVTGHTELAFVNITSLCCGSKPGCQFFEGRVTSKPPKVQIAIERGSGNEGNKELKKDLIKKELLSIHPCASQRALKEQQPLHLELRVATHVWHILSSFQAAHGSGNASAMFFRVLHLTP